MGFDEVSESNILKRYETITEEEFLILKKRYDKDFTKYWTYGKNPPKYGIISMDEFKERLKNSTPEFFKKYGKI